MSWARVPLLEELVLGYVVVARLWESGAGGTGAKTENPDQCQHFPRSLRSGKLFSGWAVTVVMQGADPSVLAAIPICLAMQSPGFLLVASARCHVKQGNVRC